ncbi:MAG: acetolactate synthase large subunit [Alphaproteobacteria bacterium]
MNGAEALVRTLVASGVEVVFTNPGTSEMHLVAAIDRVEGMRAVLGLFEGVVTGAADGYGRMADKPAATLLHLGPGLGNGIANLHNARRGRSPIVNIVGDHATYHLHHDAPLTSDLAGIAGPVSAWYRTALTADSLPGLGAEAVAASRAYPGRIATLAVPADTAWNEGAAVAAPVTVSGAASVPADRIEAVAKALRDAKSPALVLGSRATLERGLEAAGRIAEASGAALYCDTFNKRVARGAGRVKAGPIPYFGETAMDALSAHDLMVFVGTKVPVAFFAYPGKPSLLVPEGCAVETLAGPEEDAEIAAEALADTLGAAPRARNRQAPVRPDLPEAGALTADGVGRVIGALMPDNAIMVDEGVTAGLASFIHTLGCPPHDWLSLTGGAIGWGLPTATGAAVACPDRKVICLHGDGGAMYTVQALWTMARENLDVLTVIFDNRSYAILNIELARVGAENPGPKALSMLDIGRPDLNWVKLAEGMGVTALRAETTEDFIQAFKTGLATKGPVLIDAVI